MQNQFAVDSQALGITLYYKTLYVSRITVPLILKRFQSGRLIQIMTISKNFKDDSTLGFPIPTVYNNIAVFA